MADGRRNNGGNKNAGRKPKAEELKAAKMGIEAITKVYGSVDEYWEFIASQSMESFPHMKLIHEYTYGKVTEKKDIILDSNIIIDMAEWE